RRDFLELTAGSIAATFRSPWGSRTVAAGGDAGAGHAGLVVLHAKVYNGDSRMPQAEAVSLKNGRFLSVGANEKGKRIRGKDTLTVDAKQMTVVPGFIDCHNHAGGEVLLYEVLVGNPFDVEFVTIASIIDKLRAKARQTPPGTWVEGYFFDDTKVKDKRGLNVHDL